MPRSRPVSTSRADGPAVAAGDASGMTARTFYAALAGLLLLAALLRIGAVLESQGSDYHRYLVLDSATYHRIAVEGDPAEPYWQPPLYPWFLRGVYAVAGGPSPLAARLVQAALGTLGVGLLVLLVCRLGSRRAALIAAAIAALSGSMIYFDGELLPASPGVVLLLAWLNVLAWPGSGEGFTRLVRAALAGLLLGVLGLLLPSMALAGALVLVWLWRREGLVAALVMAAAAAAAILPVTIRNQTYEADPVPVSWNGGVNFWIANNPDFPESVGIRPGIDWGHLVERPRCEGGARTRAAESRWFFGEGRRYIVSEPIPWLGDEARKLVGTVSALEIGRNRNPYDARGESRILALLLAPGLPFGLLFPLCAAALSALIRERRLPWLLLLAAAGILLAGLVFFPTGRYRLPAVPLMIAIGALGMSRLRWVDGAVALIALGLALLPHGFPVIPAAETPYEIAIDLSQSGKAEQSLEFFERAKTLDPDSADIRAGYGLALAKVGRLEESASELEAAVQLDPSADIAWQALGSRKREEQDFEGAEALLRKAVEADPCNQRHRAALAQVLMDRGLYRAAREQIDQAKLRYPRRDRLVERAAERLDRLEGRTRR